MCILKKWQRYRHFRRKPPICRQKRHLPSIFLPFLAKLDILKKIKDFFEILQVLKNAKSKEIFLKKKK